MKEKIFKYLKVSLKMAVYVGIGILGIISLAYFFLQYVGNDFVLFLQPEDFLFITINVLFYSLISALLINLAVKVNKMEKALFEISEVLLQVEENIVELSRDTQKMIAKCKEKFLGKAE